MSAGCNGHILPSRVRAQSAALASLLPSAEGGGLWRAAGGFFLPTLAGNVAGCTALFARISRGQIHDEIA